MAATAIDAFMASCKKKKSLLFHVDISRLLVGQAAGSQLFPSCDLFLRLWSLKILLLTLDTFDLR
jgi:hypothetical protein